VGINHHFENKLLSLNLHSCTAVLPL